MILFSDKETGTESVGYLSSSHRTETQTGSFQTSKGAFSAATGPTSVTSDCRNRAFYTCNPVNQTSLTKGGALATLVKRHIKLLAGPKEWPLQTSQFPTSESLTGSLSSPPQVIPSKPPGSHRSLSPHPPPITQLTSSIHIPACLRAFELVLPSNIAQITSIRSTSLLIIYDKTKFENFPKESRSKISANSWEEAKNRLLEQTDETDTCGWTQKELNKDGYSGNPCGIRLSGSSYLLIVYEHGRLKTAGCPF